VPSRKHCRRAAVGNRRSRRQRIQLEQQLAAAQESLTALRQRREESAQTASQHAARVATLEERHRSAAAVYCSASNLCFRRWASAFTPGLADRIRRRRKAAARTENEQLAQHAADLEAERNAAQAREGLLQFETEQLRARLAEIDELCATAALLDQARDRRGELSAAAAKLNPTRNTCPKPA
jgi:hypothetical protein